MRVSIWDLDWYHKFNHIPNYKAQKVSSFYKQKGALINFIEEESHINFEYDIMFIFRDKKITPMPGLQYIDNKNVYLVGDEFKYYDNQFELTMEMDMVRPDYLLYDIPEGNAYANAHVLKMMHGRRLLPARQDHTNYHVRYSQKTLVVDEYLWDLNSEDLKKVLTELIDYKNIAFSKPIKLKGVFYNEESLALFRKLNFMSGTIMDFRNNHSSTYEEAVKIIDLAAELKEKNKRVIVKPIPFKAVIYNHWKDRSKGIVDLERVLKIVAYSKEKEVDIIVKTPLRRLTTPFWYFFDNIEVWTSQYPYLSYVESMVSSRTSKTKEKWYEVLNDSLKWSTPRIHFLLHLLTSYPYIILQHGIIQSKDKKLDITLIKIEEIVKFKNHIKRLEEIQKLEEEFSKEVKI